MPDPQQDPLYNQLLQKATSIGPARMGDRYMMPKNPSLFDMFKQMMGGERPKSVVEQDPTGGLTYLAGKGPAPGLVMGSTEEVSPLAKQLYSRLTRAFESAPEAMHPNKAASIAKSAAPAEEAQWRKLPEMLASKGNQPVKKAEILSHLEQNPIKLKETVLGGDKTKPVFTNFADGVQEQPAHPTKYSQHTLPGGENYRENLVQLDTPKKETGGWKVEIRRVGLEGNPVIRRFDTREQAQQVFDNRRSLGMDVTEPSPITLLEQPAFTQGHFEQPNVLVHTRTKDRNLLGNGTQVPTGRHLTTITNLRNNRSTTPDLIDQATLDHLQATAKDVDMSISHKPEMAPHKGPKGTFIEELQSDWHQKGKEQGYQSAELNARNKTRLAEIKPKIDQLYKETERIAGEQYALERQYNEAQGYRGPTWFAEGNTNANPAPTPFMRDSELLSSDDTANPVFKQYQYLQKEYERLTSERDALNAEARVLAQDRHNGVPDAPFKESWPDLGLKRELLGVANDPEKSWLGWTTGADQAKRYDLSKQISKIHYSLDQSDPNGNGLLEAWNLNGKQIMQNYVRPEELPDHIGKEASKALTSGENAERLQAGIHAELAGQNLEVGGEGMKEFYDKLLPARMNKILKPFGGQVEKGAIPTGRTIPLDMEKKGDGTPETFQAWIAKLTPEMKSRIQKEGLPLLTSLYLVWQRSQKPVEAKQ